jgi:hypothetical protein
MGVWHSKSSTTSTPKVPINIPSSSAPSVHPCRLMEFEDKGVELRLMSQLTTGMNRNINSPFAFTEQGSCRRPDPCTLLFLTPNILNEVEQALVTYSTVGRLSKIINSRGSCSFKAVSFKRSEMNRSPLDVAIIEAALTHIIHHLDDHPKLVAALGTAKIGYHDGGMALEDIGVRVFVVKGCTPDSTT